MQESFCISSSVCVNWSPWTHSDGSQQIHECATKIQDFPIVVIYIHIFSSNKYEIIIIIIDTIVSKINDNKNNFIGVKLIIDFDRF